MNTSTSTRTCTYTNTDSKIKGYNRHREILNSNKGNYTNKPKNRVKQRYIAFRAWDKKEHKYIYNAEYDLGKYLSDLERYQIEQFTGEYDCNHTRIYENDLVRVPYVSRYTKDNQIEVQYKDCLIKFNNGSFNLIWQFATDDLEVVGNINESNSKY